MGIPGLARRLEPYAAQHSPGALDGYSAIIDGPALAYFGHRLALAASTDVAKLPSYKDVIRETIRWLDHLESINIRVYAPPYILFSQVGLSSFETTLTYKPQIEHCL